MDRVTAKIEQDFEAQLAACDRIAGYAKYELLRQWPGRQLEDTADGLVLALLARSHDTFSGVLLLARAGYGAQASMLNRSLFEDMVDAHWIATDPDAARQRYEDHHEHARMLLADAVSKYPEHYGDLELPEANPDDRARLDGLYTRYGSKPWSGISLHERVELIDHHWTDEDGRRTLRFFRDIAHRENNQTLHVSSASLNAVVEASTDGGLRFNVGPRLDMLDRVLFGAFWIFDQTIGLVVDRFGIDVDEETRTRVFSARDFVTLTDEQLRTTGRNDPCPCGSGIKFKRCHGS